MILDAYLQDPDTEALISDAALVAAMLEVEASLARVQGRLGIIPAEAADRIVETATSLDVDIPALGLATVKDGVPITDFVAQLRAGVGEAHGGYVHWGATSQDIVDTALVLLFRVALDLLAGRLDELIGVWGELADRHRATVMAARTRNQQAVPTTFGLKAAGWIAPLLRHRRRLEALQKDGLMLQFGGAGGTLAALGDRGPAVVEALAAELELPFPIMPWHNQRDGFMDLANWLSMTSGSLGKAADDILRMAQSEVGEVRIEGAGGSSTMPQKANPVLAEAVVALSRHNVGLAANMQHAALHAHERDGVAWTMEWLALPQMVRTSAAALRHSLDIARNLHVDAERMQSNCGPSLLAEAAVFALSEHMTKAEAQALVKAALTEATGTRDMFQILAGRTTAPVDWEKLRDPRTYLGAADVFIDRILEEIKS